MKANNLRKVSVSTSQGMVDLHIAEITGVKDQAKNLIITVSGTWSLAALTGPQDVPDDKRQTRIGLIGMK